MTESSFKRVVALSSKVGDVSILVNNAAVVHGKTLMDSDDDALLKSQHINTLGQFWVRAAEAGAFLIPHIFPVMPLIV